jgi:hypothetical protein
MLNQNHPEIQSSQASFQAIGDPFHYTALAIVE